MFLIIHTHWNISEWMSERHSYSKIQFCYKKKNCKSSNSGYLYIKQNLNDPKRLLSLLILKKKKTLEKPIPQPPSSGLLWFNSACSQEVLYAFPSSLCPVRFSDYLPLPICRRSLPTCHCSLSYSFIFLTLYFDHLPLSPCHSNKFRLFSPKSDLPKLTTIAAPVAFY